MKRLVSIYTVSLLAAVFVFGCSLLVASAEPEKVKFERGKGGSQERTFLFVGDDNFPPYSFVANGELAGIDCDLVREMTKRAGISADIQLVPWGRLLKMVQTGACDGAFSLFMTDERKKFADFILAKPVHESVFRLFVKKGKEFPFQGLGDLCQKRVGINRGFTISDEFSSASRAGRFQVEEVEGIHYNIRKLLRGRIDVILDNYHVASHSLAAAGVADQIVSLPTPVFEGRQAYFVLSKAAPLPNRDILFKKISKSLEAIYLDGTYQKILNKYIRH